MGPQSERGNGQNYDQLQDSFSNILINKLSQPQKREVKSQKEARRTKSSNPSKMSPTTTTTSTVVEPTRDAEELAEFTEYIASLIFDSLPPELQTMTHHIWAANPTIQEKYSLPLTGADISTHGIDNFLDATVSESLIAYGIISPPAEDITNLLASVLTSYLTAVVTPPPPPCMSKGKITECEICERDWVPLTYHHLIPRFVHEKAVKRGWHTKEDLQNVAWLCRACHTCVHRFASNEDLARKYFTVNRLLEEEEVRVFAAWVSRIRWKGL